MSVQERVRRAADAVRQGAQEILRRLSGPQPELAPVPTRTTRPHSRRSQRR